MSFNFYSNILEAKNNILTTKEEIKKWLNEQNLFKFSINDDLTVDMDNMDVSIYLKGNNLPVKFRKCKSNFDLIGKSLNSLIGLPDIIEGSLNIEADKLKKIDFFPKKIGKGLFFSSNSLTSLEGMDNCEITGKIRIETPNVKSLKGYPLNTTTDIDLALNLTILIENFPNIRWGDVKDKMFSLYNANHFAPAVDIYLKVLKNEEITDKNITYLYSLLDVYRSEKKYKNQEVFTNMILSEIEKLQRY